MNIVHLYWEYDHDVDPFDLGKICILFCSDSFYAGSLSVSSVGYPAQALYYRWNYSLPYSLIFILLTGKCGVSHLQPVLTFLRSGGGGLVEESLSLCSEERAGLGYSELRSR